MNQSVESHHQAVEKLSAKQTELMGSLDSSVREQNAGLKQATASMRQAAETVAGTSGVLRDSAAATQQQVARVAEESIGRITRTVDLSGLHETAAQTLTAVAEARGELSVTRDAVLAGQQGMAAAAAQVKQVSEQIGSSAAALAGAAGDVSRLIPVLEDQTGAIMMVQVATSAVQASVERQGQDLTSVSRRVTRLETVIRWVERAQRAPIMRFLTLGGGGAAAPGAGGVPS